MRSYSGPIEIPVSLGAPRVVVLGGGYVAVKLCHALRKPVAERQIDLTVVTGSTHHVFHGFVGEMVTGRVSPTNILSSVRRLFAPAKVHVGEIQTIDLDGRRAIVARGIDGQRTEIGWDHVVLALGTEDRTDAYPGLEEHAFKLRAYEDCFALKNHVIDMFELADVERDAEERRRLLTFFIAGGGFAGVEVAGELADFARRLTGEGNEYPHLRYEECRFVLVHPEPAILPELLAFPGLVRRATRHIEELGVELRAATRVAFATPQQVTLSSGEKVPTRTIISAVGTRPNPVVAGLDLEKDDRGRIRVERTGLVTGRRDVWAGGDCAAFPMPKGGDSPSVALYAYKHGEHIGRNLRRVLLENAPPKPFKWPGLAQGASVGRRWAVGEVKGIQVTGLPAWLTWRLLLTYYFPSWDRRLRLFADWLIWPVVGRDIVAPHVGERGEYDILHNVFQPGEVIVSEERAGRYIHIIIEGEVEILPALATPGGAAVPLATLHPGDHFGQRWLEASEPEVARAKTVVRTLAVRRDQAPRLQEVMRSAGRLVAESGHFPVIIPDAVTRPGD
ncbi:MAG TPA: FAD-dependent oxidoreductase [Solirubrobacteraceae bacterium]|nr:FAD-dependent oxidoreductase [Solirubrobacteraceae bacterium]